MRVKHYAQGKFYVIQCPEGTRVVHRSDLSADGEAVPHDHLVVPLNGTEVRIPARVATPAGRDGELRDHLGR